MSDQVACHRCECMCFSIMSPDSSCSSAANTDLICFSHLRWSHGAQRPQQLMMRFAEKRRVFFVEEPTFAECESHLAQQAVTSNLSVVTPHLDRCLAADGERCALAQRRLLEELVTQEAIRLPILWYYT